MSLFNTLFGSTTKYSQKEHQLSSSKIEELVSRIRVKSLDQQEENMIEQAIIARRRGDGKISLAQIYEALTKLKNLNEISQSDKDGLMKVFSNYFEKL